MHVCTSKLASELTNYHPIALCEKNIKWCKCGNDEEIFYTNV